MVFYFKFADRNFSFCGWQFFILRINFFFCGWRLVFLRHHKVRNVKKKWFTKFPWDCEIYRGFSHSNHQHWLYGQPMSRIFQWGPLHCMVSLRPASLWSLQVLYMYGLPTSRILYSCFVDLMTSQGLPASQLGLRMCWSLSFFLLDKCNNEIFYFIY